MRRRRQCRRLPGPARRRLYITTWAIRLGDITSKPEVLTAETNPFPVKYAAHSSEMFFYFSEYGHQLVCEFFGAGGKIVMRDFHSLAELGRICPRR